MAASARVIVRNGVAEHVLGSDIMPKCRHVMSYKFAWHCACKSSGMLLYLKQWHGIFKMHQRQLSPSLQLLASATSCVLHRRPMSCIEISKAPEKLWPAILMASPKSHLY